MTPPVIVHLPYLPLQASTTQIPAPDDPDYAATVWCWANETLAVDTRSPFVLAFREPQDRHRHCWVFQWSTLQEVWVRIR